MLAVELRGTDHGCTLRKDMCQTVGTLRIPGVTFAKSVVLHGAQGFNVEMGALKLTDLPATEPAGKALPTLPTETLLHPPLPLPRLPICV